jgi:hypothetical protein
MVCCISGLVQGAKTSNSMDLENIITVEKNAIDFWREHGQCGIGNVCFLKKVWH